MKLSIVTTLYRSAGTVEEFYRRCLAASKNITEDIELIMVNDGSPDNSGDLAIALQRNDPRLTIIDLSRNFGHHKAMMTGLSYAQGNLVFLIDSDLEEEPELLERFVERFASGDCDVVYGVQASRRGGAIERLSGNIFFSLVELLSDRPLPRNLVTARVMTHDYVRALVRHRDREFVIADLWQLTGFRQVPIVVPKLSLSKTNYSLGRRIQMAVKHLTTTSTRILYVVFYTGLTIFMFSIFAIVFYTVRYFTSGIGVDGFASIIVSLWFLGGMIALILGIFGIYLANIFSESKRRPYSIVRHVYRGSPD